MPAGIVRITAPADFAVPVFVDSMAEFLTRYPRVRAEILLKDERVNPIESGIDVALRTGRLADSSLVARKLAAARRVFCASPDYLATRGIPTEPDDLRQHDCIVIGPSLGGATWAIEGPGGVETVPVPGPVAANTVMFALRAAVSGLGIVQLPEAMAAGEIRAGRLMIVLEQYGSPPGGPYLVYPSSQHLSAAARALIDHLVERFAGADSYRTHRCRPNDPRFNPARAALRKASGWR